MSEIPERLVAALAERYQVERELGEGGMATVYLAADLRHDRSVAIKVLRPELAAVIGAERFLHEITTTANLQHPHILPLFDSGEADGFLYYVMPFIDGETVRDKLDRESQFGIDEAVRIAANVADALDYAHRQHVIHRDVKPENILLHDGQPVVADFGIALAVSAAGGPRLTGTGLSMGTPHYMSPEQAAADRDLDARSDIYALGTVLYEMLAGEPPFTGPNAQAVVAKILTDDPVPLSTRRRTVPPHVEAAVHAALEKIPADRPSAASVFAQALSGGGAATHTVRIPGIGVASRRTRFRPLAQWWQVGLVAVTAATLGHLARRPPPAPSDSVPTARFRLAPRWGTAPEFRRMAFSPNGRRLVYVGGGADASQLYLRPIDQVTSTPIEGTEGGWDPFFSPDGEWIAFVANGRLRKRRLGGGPVTTIAETEHAGSWAPNDDVVVPFTGRGLSIVASDGGGPRTLTVLDTSRGELDHVWPDVLPDGRHVVFTIWKGAFATAHLAVVSIETGVVTPLVPGHMGRYADPGVLVYAADDGSVLAMPFDSKRARAAGPARRVLASTEISFNTHFALSRSGSVAYTLGARAGRLSVVSPEGVELSLGLPEQGYSDPEYSPNNRNLALRISDADASTIWVYNFPRGTLRPITSGGYAGSPTWTPDGRSIIFAATSPTSADRHLFRVPADGSADPEPVVSIPGAQSEPTVSPNGRYLVFRQQTVLGPALDDDLWVLPTGDTARPLLTTSDWEGMPSVSPDGSWLAYVSNRTGREEVWVRAFPDSGAVHQVSVNGGREPVWASNGRVLHYRRGTRFLAIEVETADQFAVVSEPTVLFEGPYLGQTPGVQYDINNADHFVVIKTDDDAETVVVALNWVSEVMQTLGREQ